VTHHTSGDLPGESARVSADEIVTPALQTARPTILGAVRGAVLAFHRQGRGHDAAALTYYAVLSIVPSIVALVAVIGLFGQDPQTTDAVLELIGRVGPEAATQTFRGTVEGIIRNKDGAGTLLVLGVLGGVWSATGWLNAFFGIANAAHGTTERRGSVRRKVLQIATTLGLGLALAVLVVLVVVTGPIARDAADGLGAGDGALRVWSICKWPVAAGLAVTLLSVLFKIAPDVKGRTWRSSVIGAVLAVVAWAAASAGFGIYVASFGSYNATYGALGAIVVFLVWLWFTNAALILGTSVDAQLSRPSRSDQ
jgi:membrane protein